MICGDCALMNLDTQERRHVYLILYSVHVKAVIKPHDRYLYIARRLGISYISICNCKNMFIDE